MRRRKNLIKELQNDQGDVISCVDELENMATQFYTNLYTSEGVANMDEVLAAVLVKVTSEMNASLEAAYTGDEVKRALF